MFLKTKSFEHNGMTITLSELSTLQHIKHLTRLKEQEKKAEPSGNLQVSVEDLIRGGVLLMAISLRYSRPQKTRLPSMDKVIKQIEQEVLTAWLTETIVQTENTVLCLFGMSEFVVNNAPEQADDVGPTEPVSAGRCLTMN